MRYSSILFCVLSVALLCGRASVAGSPFDTSGETFQADLYPSQRTAVIRLTQQLCEQIRLTTNTAEFSSINIKSGASGSKANQDALMDALRHEFPQAELFTDPPCEHPQVAFSLTETAASDAAVPSGRVTVAATGEGIALNASAKFVEKPWADDWTMFRNANTKKRYLLASSSRPCTSETEAIASARSEAVEALLPMVRSTMNANATTSGGERIIVTDDWIRNRLKYSVDSNASKVLVSDTFVQKFNRPYGDVWQASILLDASQSTIQLLNESYNRTARAQFGKSTRTWTAMAGTAVVIGLLYAFVNAVTRGYFMWRLRAVAFLAAIAGVLVLFAANT